MPTQLDVSVGLKKESAFGTPVVVDHFPEFLSESLTWEPKFAQGAGMRVGSRAPRSARRSLVSQMASGDIELEFATKGMGIFFEAALGAGASAALTSPAFQQTFTPAVDDFAPSYTLQKGLPLLGGARQGYTFPGAMCSGFELTAGLEEIVKLKTSWIARELQTAPTLAAPSYPAGVELLTFVHGSIVLGGTVVAPTGTTLATGGTAAANIRDASISVENNLDGGGMNFGGGGKLTRKKALGALGITGKLTAEYDSNVLRDAYIAQNDLALILQFQSLVQIGASGVFPTLQVVVPNIRLEGDIPAANGGDVITQSVDFTGLDNLTAAAPIWVIIRTTDTAI